MSTLTQRLSRVQPSAKFESSRVIPLGEWLPDLPDFENPGALAANGVVPDIRSYRGFNAPVDQSSNALDDRGLAAFSATDSSNNVFVYAGNPTKLYELVGNAWTDESKGGGYSTSVDEVWEFDLFGDNVVATNFTDPIQFIAIGGGGAGAFADLITSTLTPKAKHMATVRQFLMLGNTNDATDGDVPNRVWWSAINDAADFDPDATTQCDFENLQGGGQVQKIVGGTEYGVIFQETQIVRADYVGSPLVFGLFPVDRSRGTPIPNSVVGHGRDIYYISEEGFFRFNGSASEPIGAFKVDRTFWNQFDIINKRYVSAAIDPKNKLVAWAFPSTGANNFTPNKIFLYNWVAKRWSEVDIEIDVLARTKTQGYTLDGLDTLGTDIDDSSVFPVSLDADFYKGGFLRFGAISSDQKLVFFNGDTVAATVDTKEVQLSAGRRSKVSATRPLVNGTGTGGASTFVPGDLPSGVSATATRVQVGGRAKQADDVSFDSVSPTTAFGASILSSGKCSADNDARYHRARVTVDGGVSTIALGHAFGVEFTYTPTGDR